MEKIANGGRFLWVFRTYVIFLMCAQAPKHRRLWPQCKMVGDHFCFNFTLLLESFYHNNTFFECYNRAENVKYVLKLYAQNAAYIICDLTHWSSLQHFQRLIDY